LFRWNRIVLQEVAKQCHAKEGAARSIYDLRWGSEGDLIDYDIVVVALAQIRHETEHGERRRDDVGVRDDLMT
jgi:hypothetical protein